MKCSKCKTHHVVCKVINLYPFPRTSPTSSFKLTIRDYYLFCMDCGNSKLIVTRSDKLIDSEIVWYILRKYDIDKLYEWFYVNSESLEFVDSKGINYLNDWHKNAYPEYFK